MLQLYAWLRSFGYEADLVDYEESRQAALRVPSDNPLFALAPMLGTLARAGRSLDLDAYLAIDPKVEFENLLSAIGDSGITCPPLDEMYVHSTLRYLVDTGYLPPPTAVAATGPR